MYESEIYNNQMIGINVTGKSSVSLRGGNKVYENADNSGWRAGIGAAHGSTVIMTDSPSEDFNMVYQNNGPGIHIGNPTSLFV